MDLFETYYTRVFLFARQSLPPSQAEDIAQEVFFRLMKLKNLERQSISVSYLLKIADNIIKRRYSRSQRFARYVEECSQHHQLDHEPDPERGSTSASHSSSSAWDDAAIEQAFSRLSSEEQDAINLIVCQGMSYEDAAYSLGVPTSTVNNWKFRGLRKLRDSLDLDQESTSAADCVSTPHRIGTEHGRRERTTGMAVQKNIRSAQRPGRTIEPKTEEPPRDAARRHYSTSRSTGMR